MPRTLSPAARIERSILSDFRKPLWRPFVRGIKQYKMIAPGDHIAVCISGGKDSMLLAKMMQLLQRHTDIPFETEFLVMDAGYNAENRQRIIDNAALMEIPIRILTAAFSRQRKSPSEIPATSAPECAAVSFTIVRRKWAATKSHLGITSTMLWKRPSWVCSTVPSCKRCCRSCTAAIFPAWS